MKLPLFIFLPILVSPIGKVCFYLKIKNLSRKERFHHKLRDYSSLIFQNNKLVLQDLAPIPNGTVAGRHRASPSATLDKRTLYSYKVINLILVSY
jgi:hypothetical protein